ncbi:MULTISPECIES: glucoamylase family protein [Enterobacterales]|uniref:glucoamylase family protein n=1 Tax=Enterobacterales TaxID=91347 RepID=UPI002EDBA114
MSSEYQDVQPEVICQENDPAIVYTGNWSRYTGRTYSYDGASMALYDNGRYFEFTFDGTGVGYYSEGNTDQGDVDFYIDGVFSATISTYRSPRQFSDLMYYVTGLPKGTHVLKGVKKSGTWMLLDLLKIYNDGPLVATAEPLLGAGSDGTLRLQFNQSLDPQSATLPANYQLNLGASVVSVTLSNDRKTADLIISGLTTNSEYTLSLTNIYNQILTTSVENQIFTLAYTSLPAEQLYDDAATDIVYAGNWTHGTNRTMSIYNQTTSYTQNNNSGSFSLNFYGTGVAYYAESNTDQGDVEIYIDGVSQGRISTWTSSHLQSHMLYSRVDLPFGAHTIQGIKRSGTWAHIDALKVYNAGSLEILETTTDSNGNIRITFDQALDSESALQLDNYSLNNGGIIDGVTLDVYKTTLMLHAPNLVFEQTYQVTLHGLKNEILTKDFADLQTSFTNYQGMKHYYTFDNQINGAFLDTISGKRDAVMYGREPVLVAGKLAQGCEFDRRYPAYVDLGVFDCLQQPGFTVEAWIYPRSLAMSTIVSQDTRDNNNQRWLFYCQNNQLSFTMSDNTNQASFTLTTRSYIPLNAWSHVAVIRLSSDEFALAINGNIVMCGGSNIKQSANNCSVKVGGRLNSRGEITDAFDGVIDEVKMFDSALSTSTLVDNYRPLAEGNFTLEVNNGAVTARFVQPQSVLPAITDFRLHSKVNSEMRTGLPLNDLIWDTDRNEATLTFTPFEHASVEQNVAMTLRYQGMPVDAQLTIPATTVEPPSISLLTLKGELKTREVLRADYHYSDPENVAESGSEYLWEVADSASGIFSPIEGVHTRTLMLLPEHKGKHIRVTVTPRNARLCPGVPQMAVVGPIAQQSGNPRTDWFRNAKYGVSHHFLPNYLNLSPDIPPREKWHEGESWDDFLSTFDVVAYAKAVQETGAGFVLLTMDQHAGYNLGPSKTHDAILGVAPGVRSAIRDLPLEMAKELAKYGIKFMLYMMGYAPAKASLVYYDSDANPHSPDRWGDMLVPRLYECSPFDNLITPETTRLNYAVVREFGDRYGEYLAGFWFDGMWNNYTDMSQPYNINDVVDASRSGNPQRIVTGIGVDNTVYMDYSNGESYGTKNAEGNYVMTELPTSRWQNNDGYHQWFRWIALGNQTVNAGWGAMGSTDTGKHYDTDSLAQWVKDVAARDGVACMDIRINRFGELDPIVSDQLAAVKAAVYPTLTNDQLLDKVQQTTLRYFWDYAHPTSGLAFERLYRNGDAGINEPVTTGGTGFGIMGILVAVERGFITRQQGYDRINQMVDFLGGPTTRYKGAWPHWLNGNTGATIPFGTNDNGADLVETAFLVEGLLTARQYFNDPTLATKINALWHDIDWNYFTNNSDSLYWHIDKDLQFTMGMKVTGWNEAMMTYLLAIASPTHPVAPTLWESGWSQGTYSNKNKVYYDVTLPIGPTMGGPMFFMHYSFMGFDPRNLRDTANDVNYYQQGVAQSQIQQAYSVDNPHQYIGYSDKCWGLTAGYSPTGYTAHQPTQDDGTITITAALSSLPYLPDASMAALRHFYDDLGNAVWTEKCGFIDGFNMSKNWYSDGYLAIDQGPIIGMIENHRSGLLWRYFMSCPEIQQALSLIGFAADDYPPRAG